MDLSKIPEPSAAEIDRAEFLVEDQRYFKLTDDERILCRVIAHILRHASALAKNIDIEMVDSDQLGEVLLAIEFFEKFGGSDER